MMNKLICAVCGQPVASANKPHMNCSPELREKLARLICEEYCTDDANDESCDNFWKHPQFDCPWGIAGADAIISLLTGGEDD